VTEIEEGMLIGEGEDTDEKGRHASVGKRTGKGEGGSPTRNEVEKGQAFGVLGRKHHVRQSPKGCGNHRIGGGTDLASSNVGMQEKVVGWK
jgi:hypothetical protein